MISRRSFGIGVVALVSGDGLRRPQNAPPGVSATPGVQPGVSNGNVFARRVIVFGPNDGVYVYNGAPVKGNPPIAWISNTLTDPYGNALIAQGIVSFESPTYTQLFGGQLVIGNTSAGAIADFLINDSGVLVLQGTAGVTSLAVSVPISQPLYASNPSAFGTAETWHEMSLLNGWANAAGNVTAQYRLVASPPNSVEVIGALEANAATAATFFTLPAGYRPASQQQVACGATGGQVAGSTPFAQCDAGGNLTVQHDTIGAADAYLFHGFISLDA